MNAVVDCGLMLVGAGLDEVWRWYRSWRYPLTMTVEAVEDTEANAIRELAARSRRTQEQMRRVAFRHQRGQA